MLLMSASAEESNPGQRQMLAAFLEQYRRIVNANLLYVNVGFASKSSGFADKITPEHENNVYISGFSDQILRYTDFMKVKVCNNKLFMEFLSILFFSKTFHGSNFVYREVI